jgi:hypothetical protein
MKSQKGMLNLTVHEIYDIWPFYALLRSAGPIPNHRTSQLSAFTRQQTERNFTGR